MKTQPGKFTLIGDGLCVGCDSGDAVSQEYKTPGTFKGETIFFVGVTVEKSQYLDLEAVAKRMMKGKWGWRPPFSRQPASRRDASTQRYAVASL